MCQDRTVGVYVKIPADLSCSGEAHWKEAQVDACIAPLVQALQLSGVDMRGSCCGHGKGPGHIELQDGRGLLVLSPGENKAWGDAGLSRIVGAVALAATRVHGHRLTTADAEAIEAEMRRMEEDPTVTKHALRLYLQSLMPCGHAVGNLLTCPDPPAGCVACGSAEE